MIEKRYGKKVDDVDDTIIDITEDGNDFAWFLNDDYTDEQVDKVVQRLNKLIVENEQLKLDKHQLHRAMSREEVRYKQFKDKVFALIDEKIKESDGGFEQTYDSWYQGKIDVLTELKKELSE